jgi:ribosomal 50S subunit-associated protein YjgA (DUF615 family)
MAEGELGAIFKGLAKDAAEAAGNITESMAKLAERTADIEESNVAKVLKLDEKAAEDIAAAPRRVLAPNPAMEPVTIKIERQPFMPRSQFRRKMDALKKLGEEGKLFKATNPVLRNRRVTDGFREALRQRIKAQYGQRNRDFARQLIYRVNKLMQPDHIWDLQLGGPDVAGNLRFLDAATNRELGTQIRTQLMHLPDGTPIRIEVVD